MVVDWKGLAEGIRNKIYPKEELKALIKETHAERMAICNVCDYHRGTGLSAYCAKCGCNLELKTNCLSCNCPLEVPKWIQKITREEDAIVKEELNG